MEALIVPWPKFTYPETRHLVLEAWGVKPELSRSPERISEAIRRYLSQLGLEPGPHGLEKDFDGTAASVVVVNHRDNEELHGYTSVHTWPEHSGYVNLVFKDDKANITNAQLAFAEAFEPGEPAFDRPPNKLAHIIGQLLVINKHFETGSGQTRLEILHHDLIKSLGLNTFGKKIWAGQRQQRRVLSAFGLWESHSIIEATTLSEDLVTKVPEILDETFASVVVDLFSCAGTNGVRRAPELISEFFHPLGNPIFREVDYYSELPTDSEVIQSAKRISVLARRIGA